MKKIMQSLVFAGLITGSMTSAIMSPKRLWNCATAPDKNNCSADERKTAKGWLIGGSIAALTAFLTAFGIVRGPEIVRQARRDAIDKDIKNLRMQRDATLDPQDMRSIDMQIEELHEKRSETNIN